MSDSTHKNNMEEFFRSKAEEYNFSYDVDKWRILEKRLDAEKRKRRKYFFVLIGALLLPMGAIGYWMFNNHTVAYSDINELSLPRRVETQLEYCDTIVYDKHVTKAGELWSSNLIEIDKKSLREDDLNTKIKIQIGKTKVSLSENASDLARDFNTTSIEHQDAFSPEMTDLNQFSTNDSHAPRAEKLVPDQVSLNSITKNASLILPPEVIYHLAIKPLSVKRDVFSLPFDLIASSENEVNKGFALSMSTALDYSFTSAPIRDLDIKLGLGASYYINSHLGVGVGINYVDDKYVSSGTDYRPYPGYWTRGITPETINARCRMIEVPINFVYHLSDFKQTGWLFQGGISSIFFLKEAYKYNYRIEDPDLRQGWYGTNRNRTFFSTLHLGAAYQLKFDDHSSLRIKPYTNIPVANIGYGNVRLSSIGIEISFQLF